MKKYLFASMLLMVISSCNNGAADSAENNDSAGITNGSAIDTTKVPSGVDNSSVISTDTAAMNTQNAINKADSANKKNQ